MFQGRLKSQDADQLPDPGGRNPGGCLDGRLQQGVETLAKSLVQRVVALRWSESQDQFGKH
jgi:hypothetical protein